MENLCSNEPREWLNLFRIATSNNVTILQNWTRSFSTLWQDKDFDSSLSHLHVSVKLNWCLLTVPHNQINENKWKQSLTKKVDINLNQRLKSNRNMYMYVIFQLSLHTEKEVNCINSPNNFVVNYIANLFKAIQSKKYWETANLCNNRAELNKWVNMHFCSRLKYSTTQTI